MLLIHFSYVTCPSNTIFFSLLLRDYTAKKHFSRTLAFEPEAKLLDRVQEKIAEGNFTAARILEDRAEAIGAGRKGYIGV